MGHNKMPLFDLAPKDSPAALFGRDREARELARLVDARRWVAVLGPRMVGKTSLVRSLRTPAKRPAAYVNLWGVRTVQGLLEALVRGVNESQSLRARVRRFVRRVEGVSVGPGGISVATSPRPVRTLGALLDAIGAETRECVIELDEVQELAPISGRLLKLLGNLFGTHPNVVFVFTGSFFGLNRTLLEPSSSSPLYGRPPAPL
jgi:AAA+ ATPase superfamily predicted ATPase